MIIEVFFFQKKLQNIDAPARASVALQHLMNNIAVCCKRRVFWTPKILILKIRLSHQRWTIRRFN